MMLDRDDVGGGLTGPATLPFDARAIALAACAMGDIKTGAAFVRRHGLNVSGDIAKALRAIAANAVEKLVAEALRSHNGVQPHGDYAAAISAALAHEADLHGWPLAAVADGVAATFACPRIYAPSLCEYIKAIAEAHCAQQEDAFLRSTRLTSMFSEWGF